jgi:hypothetical protein
MYDTVILNVQHCTLCDFYSWESSGYVDETLLGGTFDIHLEEFGRIPKSKTAAQVESSDEFRKDSLGSLELPASKRLIYYGS